jgi:hypothetical protein
MDGITLACVILGAVSCCSVAGCVFSVRWVLQLSRKLVELSLADQTNRLMRGKANAMADAAEAIAKSKRSQDDPDGGSEFDLVGPGLTGNRTLRDRN